MRYPLASWDPLGTQTEDRMTAHDVVCIHTMVGSLDGTDRMFEADGYGGTESHFGTGGAGEKVRQWQDLAFTADANLDGNPRVLSIENADKGPGFPAWTGSNVPAFTDVQLDQLVDLVAWLCSKAAHADCPASWKCHAEGIPAVLIPDSKPGRRGIGYHRQGIDGSLPDMRVPGGELWSSSRGKICPGDRRVAQVRDVLVPSVAAALKPPPKHLVRVQHRIVTANMFVHNPARGALVSGPLAGVNQIVARVKADFRFPPDVIAVQEGQRILDELEHVEDYNLFDVRTDGEASKEIPVLLLSKYKCLGVEYHHAADGTGSGALDHARGILIVKYVKRGEKVAVINTHMGLFADEADLESGKRRPGPAALEHAAHAQKVARTFHRLKANGYRVFVTADANSRGVWSQSLPAVLEAAGMHVTLNGVDLVADDPAGVAFKQRTTVPHRQTGSDTHDALAVRTVERKATR